MELPNTHVQFHLCDQIRACKTTIWVLKSFEIYESQVICFDHLIGRLKFRTGANGTRFGQNAHVLIIVVKSESSANALWLLYSMWDG